MTPPHEATPPSQPDGPTVPLRTASRPTRVFFFLLFGAVAFISVFTPLYNRVEPQIMGIPFFFWFTFAWVIVGALLTAIAYKCRV